MVHLAGVASHTRQRLVISRGTPFRGFFNTTPTAIDSTKKKKIIINKIKIKKYIKIKKVIHERGSGPQGKW